MDQKKPVRRFFTAEQKYDILQKVEADIKSGMTTAAAISKANIGSSIYSKWKRQLSVGVKSSLRNGKPPADRDKRKLERENERLKAVILSQAQAIADLKKETNWE